MSAFGGKADITLTFLYFHESAAFGEKTIGNGHGERL
jgi:hypothetical protein